MWLAILLAALVLVGQMSAPMGSVSTQQVMVYGMDDLAAGDVTVQLTGGLSMVGIQNSAEWPIFVSNNMKAAFCDPYGRHGDVVICTLELMVNAPGTVEVTVHGCSSTYEERDYTVRKKISVIVPRAEFNVSQRGVLRMPFRNPQGR